MESLETRQVFASFEVTSLLDTTNGSDSVVTLREAIALANANSDADTITFALSLTSSGPATITLAEGQLQITAALTITGPGQTELTIDANQQSRVLHVPVSAIDVAIEGLTLTGGKTTAVGDLDFANRSFDGGAINFDSTGTLTLVGSSVTGNLTSGRYARGGGISTYSGAVTLISSSVSGNSTEGQEAYGGGIYAGSGAVTLTESSIENNTTSGDNASGGGIRQQLFGNTTLTNSFVSGNSTSGLNARGGGIDNRSGLVTLVGSTVSGNTVSGTYSQGGGIATISGNVTLTSSTISGNKTTGEDAPGGGIYTSNGAITINGSTISGNSTAGTRSRGGGIISYYTGEIANSGGIIITDSTVSGNSTAGAEAHGGGVAVRAASLSVSRSTVTGNTTTGTSSNGGGIFVQDSTDNPALSIRNSIVAGNTVASGMGPDFLPDPDAVLTVQFSLLGDNSGTVLPEAQTADSSGNLVGTSSAVINPQLASLQNNGGPTETHSLLLDSPAINAGDPAFAAPPTEDQRGAGFPRIADGRIDIGAIEHTNSVEKRASTISLGTSLTPSTFGLVVTFTASVQPRTGAGSATGQVIFDIDGVSQPAVAIVGGQATLAINTLNAGMRVIVANYVGDSEFLASSSNSIDQTVEKATPVVTWTNPADIAFGTLLSATQLNATSSAPGSFAYTPAIGAKLNAGSNQDLSVTFTPTDSVNNNTVTKTVKINVTKAEPVVTWTNPANIEFGTLLSATQLNATSSTPGSFAYTPALGARLNAGANQDLSVTFTPTDSVNNNTVMKTVKINVTKAEPVVTWTNPANIEFGTLLSATQLNATSSTPGSFAYTPALGARLNAGANQDLSVTFTPTDSVNNNTVTKTVKINVGSSTLDFGDAPVPYPVKLSDDGARHVVGSLTLGTGVADSDSDGTNSPSADADGSDDNGVVVIASLVSSAVATTSSLSIITSGIAKLDAWIDFNDDGDWLDAGEQIFTSANVVAGQNMLGFTVPANAVAGTTGARFRLSTAGSLLPTGAALDGEVEDYLLTIVAGSSSAVLTIDAPSGETNVAVEGDNVVVRKGSTVLSKVPTTDLRSIKLGGSPADDTLSLSNLESFVSRTIELDGGLGKDILKLIDGGKTLDLTDANVSLRDIEAIDIKGTGNNRLILSIEKVKVASTTTDTLEVDADSGDAIVFGTGFRVDAPKFVNGKFTHIIREIAGGGTVRIELRNASLLTNPLTPFDADRDGDILPLDARKVIDEIIARRSGPFALPTNDSEIGNLYFDVNSDGRLSPLDALRIINAIARLTPASSEAEESSAAAADVNPVINQRLAQREVNATEISEFESSEETQSLDTSSDQPPRDTSPDEEMPEMSSDDQDESSDVLDLLST